MANSNYRLLLKGKYPQLFFFNAVLMLFLAASCGKKNNDDPIPYVPIDKYINMTLPAYQALLNPGGYVVEPGGVKGLFIIQNFSGKYQCFDMNCSYHPLDDCSVLTVDSSGLLLKCGSYQGGNWVPCCGSKFGIDGYPQSTPAVRPLREYQISADGMTLHIVN